MNDRLGPALVTGLLAGLIVFTTDRLGIPAWVTFLAWTARGLLATQGIGAVGASLAFAAGLAIAWASADLGGQLPITLAWAAAPLAIGIACGAVALLASWSGSRFAASAVFVGMIAWFGSRWPQEAPSVTALLVAGALGLMAQAIATRAAVLRLPEVLAVRREH